MNFEAIKKASEGYRAEMSRFLRDMIRIPSESCEEEGVVLMCGYPIRYWPAMHFLKEEVDSGKYGKIMQMSLDDLIFFR